MTAPTSDTAAIRQIIRALRKASYVITGGHNGEERFAVTPDASEDDIIAELTACDSSNLYVQRGTVTGNVFFVLGNDPEEVVCDHSAHLTRVLDPVIRAWWS